MRSLYFLSWPNVSILVIFGFHVLLTRHVRALGRKPDKTCGYWPREIPQLNASSGLQQLSLISIFYLSKD